VEWIQTSAERDDVVIPIEEMGAKQFTQQSLAIQGSSLASTARTKQRIEETIQVYPFCHELMSKDWSGSQCGTEEADGGHGQDSR
jgi:hypothetical protein